jgi:hypothetical protein
MAWKDIVQEDEENVLADSSSNKNSKKIQNIQKLSTNKINH